MKNNELERVAMRNELLLVATLIFEYAGVVLAFNFFGRKGLFAWIALATVLANIEVMVLVEAFGIEMTLGNILFASIFLATDILSENFGKREAKQGVAIGIVSSILFVIVSTSWLFYLPSANDVNSPALHEIFTKTPRIVFASVIVYIIVQYLDVFIYHKVWEKTAIRLGGNRGLWIRNNVATISSQIINAILYNIFAFGGVYSANTLVAIIISNVIIYLITSVADTPFLYMARLKSDEKIKQKLSTKE